MVNITLVLWISWTFCSYRLLSSSTWSAFFPTSWAVGTTERCDTYGGFQADAFAFQWKHFIFASELVIDLLLLWLTTRSRSASANEPGAGAGLQFCFDTAGLVTKQAFDLGTVQPLYR
jgi:hypothetical protein